MVEANSIRMGMIAFAVASTLLVIPWHQPVQANAFQDGQNQAEEDFYDSQGKYKDPSCIPYKSADKDVDYCTAYEHGYESKWEDLVFLWEHFECWEIECTVEQSEN
jgi:hypothetical protein